MNNFVNKNDLKKIQNISRVMFWVSIFLMLIPGIQTSARNDIFFRILFFGGIVMFGSNWIIPVLFIILKKTTYAFVWSMGVEKWERVKDTEGTGIPLIEKIVIYMRFVLALVMYIVFFYLFNYILHNS